jgi:hypothetical protein
VKRSSRVGAVIGTTILLAGLLAAPEARASGPRYEEVLSWDDGTAEFTYPPAVPGWPWTLLAVRFQAPGWAHSVVGMNVYIMNDNEPNPSTQPIRFWVWESTADVLPGPFANDGYEPFSGVGEYQEDVWLEIRFPTAIDITDPARFPDGWFFVGIEWLYFRNPLLGLDADEPTYRHTIMGPGDWEWLESDVLIRAVVSSEWSPIDASSWTHIKTLFQS